MNSRRKGSRSVGIITALVLGLLGPPAIAGASGPGGAWRGFRDSTIQDYGYQWSRVGDPGNPNFEVPSPIPEFIPPTYHGKVNHKFRVMTKEVTVGQWFEFMEAYAPYVPTPFANGEQFNGSGGFIQFDGFANGVPQYHIVPGYENLPIEVGWRFAARFANWLHNDQADTAAAFESGVYDTSTFGQTQNEQGINIYTDQQARSEGARFFIPTTHEWKKAGHWDPDRYGEDQGGWWLYPTTSDTAPISDSPEYGGETNGGPFPPGHPRPIDVGSYPDVTSPWGLLDVSGGAAEWLEEFRNPFVPGSRFYAGSTIYNFNANPALWDLLTSFSQSFPTSNHSIRLASVVPAPGSVLLLMPVLFLWRVRCAGSTHVWEQRR